VFALFFTSSFGVTQVDDVSIDEGGSAEDVGGVPTPAPATLIILGAGLVIGAVARRRSR
jgi:hypothetical protein